MKVTELIDRLSRKQWELEAALEENGGELTPELMETMECVEEMKALLSGEGIDELGRWLKARQDQLETLKAEADAAARKVKAMTARIDYIKKRIGDAMDLLELGTNAAGDKVAKGLYYSFKRTTSVTGKVDADALDATFMAGVEEVLRENCIPSYVHVKLTTTVKELREAGEAGAPYLVETVAPSIRFTKPVARKEG